nr:reverse transcriptase domain-containing protein [Tanacetum cinerariifolium]
MPEDPYAYVVDAFQALPPPDYVSGLEETEQALPSPVYIPYVPKPEYPEYIPPEDEVFPAKEQPLPAATSLTTNSPGYIPEPQPPTLSFTKEDAERFLAMPIPPPSPLTPLSSLLPQIPSPPLPASPHILPIPLPTASPPSQLLSSDRRADRPEVTLPPRKRLSIIHCSGYEARESSAAAAARPIEGHRADYGFVGFVEAEIRRRIAEDIGYGIRDTWIDLRDVAEEEALTTLEGVNTRVIELAAVQEQDIQDIYRVMEDAQGRQMEIFQRVEALGYLVTALGEIQALQAREQARAARDANRTGDDSHTSGTDVRRTERVTRECTYQDFMKCQPLYFKGTEGVIELTQWFERMEMVFCIKNCLAENQVKFATCTLLAGALTWWNSHVRIVGTDVAYVMTWIELKKKMADKYYPRNEIKKIETELWNLEVQ